MIHERITVDCEDAPPRFTGAYLRIAGDECAFVDTYTSRALPKLLEALARAGRRPEDVRWVVVTHAHLDHAAGASALLAVCPRATLLAHPRAAPHLIDPTRIIAGATHFFGEARFREVYGEIGPIDAARLRTLADGETFPLGDATMHAVYTRGHANHHFVIHDPTLEAVFTGDAFGIVYPALQARGRFAILSTSPNGFDAAEARKSLDRVLGLGAKTACLTHFGEIHDVDAVASQLGAWIDRAESWLESAILGGETLPAMEARLILAWRDAIAEHAEARGLGFDAAAFHLLELDCELNGRGIAVVAAARRR